MISGILRYMCLICWLCSISFIGTSSASDIPYVFNGSSADIAGYSSDQLENISASSPDLVGVSSISNPADSEILTLPSNRNPPCGKTYATVGDFKKSINSRAGRIKGIVLFYQGRYNEALQVFDQSIKQEPDNADNWNSRGVVLNQLGRFSEAITCFDQAIRLDPLFAEPWNNKAAALCGLGDYKGALEDCDMALGLDPSYAIAWHNKGQILGIQAETATAKAIELGYNDGS